MVFMLPCGCQHDFEPASYAGDAVMSRPPLQLEKRRNDMSDVVFLNGLSFYGYHGVHPEERALGQRFKVDVSLEADLREAGTTDNLAETVSYSSVFKRVKSVMEGPPRQLIEAVAEDVATSLLAEFELATAVTITIHKPGAPIRGATFDTVGVRIRRHR